MRKVRQFVAYFHFVDWDCISLGLHVCVGLPNIEIHLPFGFIRVGFVWDYPDAIKIEVIDKYAKRTFGVNAT